MHKEGGECLTNVIHFAWVLESNVDRAENYA